VKYFRNEVVNFLYATSDFRVRDYKLPYEKIKNNRQ